MKTKNKKAIVLSQTLNIIIAIGCLVLLFYLGFELFQMLQNKTKIEQAKSTMEILTQQIEYAKEQQTKESSFVIENPIGWGIILFPFEAWDSFHVLGVVNIDNLKRIPTPSNCPNPLNCICICEEGKGGKAWMAAGRITGEGSYSYFASYSEHCATHGFCLTPKENLKLYLQTPNEEVPQLSLEIDKVSSFRIKIKDTILSLTKIA